jgi:RNA polymerase sigma-70 factor (ECF subfamily)
MISNRLASSRNAEGGSISEVNNLTSAGLKGVFLAERAHFLQFLLTRQVPSDEAEDLLQELFLKLELHAIGPVADPRSYIYRMLDNLVVDLRRAQARRVVREGDWLATLRADSSEIDDEPSAERRLIDRERLQAVANALATLPERTLFIFRRFRLDEIPQKRIAEELGISLSAVEKQLQKAYRVIVEVRSGTAAPDVRRRP